MLVRGRRGIYRGAYEYQQGQTVTGKHYLTRAQEDCFYNQDDFTPWPRLLIFDLS